MDEKMVDYFIANALTANRCLDEISNIKKALNRQIKINKRQRLINSIFIGVSVFCICKLIDFMNSIDEDPKKQKGE